MMIGTCEARIFSMMLRVGSNNPPGVFSSISNASSLLRSASAMARPTYSSVIGWMVSLRTIFSTSAEDREENTDNSNTASRPDKQREKTSLICFYLWVYCLSKTRDPIRLLMGPHHQSKDHGGGPLLQFFNHNVGKPWPSRRKSASLVTSVALHSIASAAAKLST